MRLFLFKNTRAVLVAERAAKKAGYACKIIPVPRSVSTECTMALECTEDDFPKLHHLLTQQQIELSVISHP